MRVKSARRETPPSLLSRSPRAQNVGKIHGRLNLANHRVPPIGAVAEPTDRFGPGLPTVMEQLLDAPHNPRFAEGYLLKHVVEPVIHASESKST